MALKDEVHVWMVGEVLLEVGCQGIQRRCLAVEQAAVRIGLCGPGGLEIDAVQREPLFYRALVNLDCGVGLGLAATPVAYKAIHGVSSGSHTGGIKLHALAGTGNLAAAGGVAIGQRIIVGIAGFGGDRGGFSLLDSARIREAGSDHRRLIGFGRDGDVGGLGISPAASVITDHRNCVRAFFYAVRVPAGLSAGAFNGSAGGRPFVSHGVIVGIAAFG